MFALSSSVLGSSLKLKKIIFIKKNLLQIKFDLSYFNIYIDICNYYIMVYALHIYRTFQVLDLTNYNRRFSQPLN